MNVIGLLKSKLVASGFGLIALAITIWIAGPQIAVGTSRPLQSEQARLIAIVVIIVIFALNQLRKVLKANKANKGMVEGLVDAKAAADPDRSAEEVATLKGRFEEAVEVLKKSKGKKGRLSLYDLPWYIIIGPPGSGKTTALVNSGLDFPLAERFGKEALSGVGGTRNCDWWFTNEAIMLDTAGRYVTQDSDAKVDRGAWEGFLGLLKKYRKRRPINGVIVAISLLDLMTLNEHDRMAHCRAIKSRIQELDQFFKIRFPVYVMLTKCDLIAGFMEFFDDLGRAERDQVWGMTFPIEASDAGAVDRFGAEFDALLERLNARLLWRMSQERDPRRRAAIYGFPRQLASLKDNVNSFLTDVFRASRFDQAPMLRGVYFTSGTQEGTPIDRLMGMVARTFGVEQSVAAPAAGRGRSYFLKALLTDVVFRESEIAGTNRRFETQRAWLQRAAYAGSVLVVLLLVAGWSLSYFNNRSMIREVQAATTVAAEQLSALPPASEVLDLLPALDAVRGIPRVYEGGEDTPWVQGLGLNQGDKLVARSDVAYERVLRESLLPRLIARTEAHLRGGGASEDFQYEALKAYLMLDSRDHYDAGAVVGWFEFDFDQFMFRGATPAQRETFLAHINALFDEQPVPLPVPLDQNLIDQTQRVVARIPTEQRIYSRLRRSTAAAELREFTVFNAAGPQSQIAFTTRGANTPEALSVDGFFSREGYRQFFTAQSAEQTSLLVDESWILGPYAPTNLDTVTVLGKVKNLYLEDFAREYERLLSNIGLAAFGTPEEAQTVLGILSDPATSPLILLVRAVAEEMQLDPPPPEQNGAQPSLGERARSTLGGLLGGDQAGQPGATAVAATSAVDQKLRWVKDLAGTDPKAPAPINTVATLFNQLYEFMAVVVAQRGVQGDVPPAVAQQGNAVFQSIRTQASRQPALVRTLLEDAVTRSQRLAFSGVRVTLNAQMSEAVSFCRTAIAGRYPIARGSTQEINIDDFGRFFAPGGMVDKYFREYLAQYVDTSSRPWRARASAAAPVQIGPNVLLQFERADAIKNTFFRGGGATPSVAFDLRPLDMDAAITRFTLDLDGQLINYAHGPPQRSALQWPAPSPKGEVRIEMTPATASESIAREPGPWAWFRVLDKANVMPTDRTEVFTADFTVGGRTAHYELIARSANNPFNFPELRQFECPEQL
jgi:type VI secretion system protein ImpL